MGKIRVLGKEDIKKVINLNIALEAVEKAYVQKHTKNGEVWPMVFHEFEPGKADLDIKSGNLNDEDIYGLKVVSWYGENPSKNLPALFGTSLIFDLKTGEPKAVLNAGPITAYRTGAAGAIGAKYLARKDSQNLVVVGCGEIATYLTAATLIVMPQLEKVIVVNPWKPELAVEGIAAMTEEVDALLKESGVERKAALAASLDAGSAVREADVILTATPSYEPLIKAEWVKPGTHFSCVGSDLTGKQEIESAIFTGAKVYGDDTAQCFNVGECEKPHKEGILKELNGEIGAVIAKVEEGRTSAEDITIFDSTGIALQDLGTAAVVLKIAKEKELGIVAEL